MFKTTPFLPRRIVYLANIKSVVDKCVGPIPILSSNVFCCCLKSFLKQKLWSATVNDYNLAIYQVLNISSLVIREMLFWYS